MAGSESVSPEQPAYVALPPSGSGPGVAVLHPWWGLNEFVRGYADRLAAAGFVVAAPDLYGDGQTVDTIPAAEQRMQSIDDEAAARRTLAAIDFLIDHPATSGSQVGAVGFSMGGSWATFASGKRPQLAAVVLYYAAGDGDWEAARAAYLGHFADGDEWEPDEYIQAMAKAMEAAGRSVDLRTYAGVGHWFAEDNRPDDYDAEAAELAWQRTIEFLNQALRGA